MKLMVFRFADSFLGPIWNGNAMAGVEAALAEPSRAKGRGVFFAAAGCQSEVKHSALLRGVVPLAMRPPARRGVGTVRTEKTKAFEAMRPIVSDGRVHGPYRGYRKKPAVAKSWDVHTCCAPRLFVDSSCWGGERCYLRAGKRLPGTVADSVVERKLPPQQRLDDAATTAGRANNLRLRLSPNTAVALTARLERVVGTELVGDQRESYLTGALNGEEAAKAATMVFDAVLARFRRAIPYLPGGRGLKPSDRLIAADGGWHNPMRRAKA
jgi:glucose-6-phosphate 1-dehydrogenase